MTEFTLKQPSNMTLEQSLASSDIRSAINHMESALRRTIDMPAYTSTITIRKGLAKALEAAWLQLAAIIDDDELCNNRTASCILEALCQETR